jgi:hypothetical protein
MAGKTAEASSCKPAAMVMARDNTGVGCPQPPVRLRKSCIET